MITAEVVMVSRFIRPGLVAVPIVLIAAVASSSPPSRDAALARIDSLHIAHRVDEAEAFIAPLLADARAAADTSFVLPLSAKLGRLRASYGLPREGEPLLVEAAALASARRDTLRWCDALRWLGYALDQQGRPAEAGAVYVRLRDLAVATADTRHEAWSLVGLAYLATRAGRYADAERDYLRAADLFHARGEAQPEVWTLGGLGAALHDAGRIEAARDCYLRVLALARDVGYEAVEAMTENNLGALVFAVGDPGRALVHYRNALAIQRALAQRQDAVITGGNIADCLLELGRFDAAETLLAELRAECEEGGFRDRMPAVLARLVRLRGLQQRPREAASVARRALSADAGEIDVGDRVKLLVNLSHALAAQDSLDAALSVLADESAERGGRTSGEAGMQLRLELGRAQAAVGRDAAAIATLDGVAATARREGFTRYLCEALATRAGAERRLGRGAEGLETLREASAVWEAVRAAPDDPQWREQRGAAGGRLASALASALLDADPAAPGADPVAAAFDAIQVFKARTMAERIGAGFADTAWRAPATCAESTAALLGPDELLLDYYLGEERSLLFAVSRAGIRVVRLAPASELAAGIRTFRDLVAFAPTASDDATIAVASESLAERIFGDLTAAVAAAGRVVVVPDGVLNLVPFAALTPPTVVWSRVPSATILATLRAPAPTRHAGAGVLAFASARTLDGESMPGAVREARALASRYRDVDLRITGNGRGGTPPDPDTWDGYAVLHLASHARADDQRPWSSEILLDPDASGEAAVLRADRIAGTPLAADLVVLSACETAAGRVQSGEGVLGLSSAFLAAGAPAVVATLWPVDDAVTALMMDAFYRELAAGAAVATALASAAAAVRAAPATRHPFYWAGFVLIGDGAETVALTPRPQHVSAFAAAVVLPVAVFLLVRRRRRSP